MPKRERPLRARLWCQYGRRPTMSTNESLTIVVFAREGPLVLGQGHPVLGPGRPSRREERPGLDRERGGTQNVVTHLHATVEADVDPVIPRSQAHTLDPTVEVSDGRGGL